MKKYLSALIVVLSIVSMSAARQHPSPSGTFSLEQADPVPGQEISFLVDVANLPTNGGASISPWVEVTCGSVYEVLSAANSPVFGSNANPTRAYFILTSEAWVAFGLNTQPCVAYLFYDGWNNPTRRKTNTLAPPLFFTATAP